MSISKAWRRFHHLSFNPGYSTMPARMRMSILRICGVEQIEAEAWMLAASAVNGCAKSVDEHEKPAREDRTSVKLMAAAVRSASMIRASDVVPGQITAAAPTRTYTVPNRTYRIAYITYIDRNLYSSA